jgi:hypothetical protein
MVGEGLHQDRVGRTLAIRERSKAATEDRTLLRPLRATLFRPLCLSVVSMVPKACVVSTVNTLTVAALYPSVLFGICDGP